MTGGREWHLVPGCLLNCLWALQDCQVDGVMLIFDFFLKPDDNAPERPPSAYVLFSNSKFATRLL